MSETAMESDSSDQPRLALRRRLGLPLLVLYGVGITVGAGIYVLIGAVAGHAGAYSPWAFLLAGIVMAFTVASYAELSTRFPVSAGEAAYVKAAFNSRLLSTAIGLSTIAIGVMSASTVTLGSVGYIQQFVDLPRGLLVVIVVVVLGAVAAWGILESVVIAGLLTLVEVGGLLAIVVAAAHSNLPVAQALTTLPPLEFHVLSSIAFASLLAFFAFIGFEDLANIVEEAKNPHRDIPRAMVFTLIISTALYVIVAAVAISAVSVERLSSSPAPLSLVFREIAGVSPATISAIAIVATLNTILAQITMAARVVYGMARQGDLPAIIGAVHPGTATPWLATALIVAAVVGLALAFPFVGLAESTSVATLAVFAVVNLALLRLKYRRVPSSAAHVNIPIWMPAAGLVSCVVMIVAALSG
jgi:basic amino acid/polyamine antiporter, APA family